MFRGSAAGCAILALVAPAQLHAGEGSAPADVRIHVIRDVDTRTHSLGLRYDVAEGATTLGLGYMHSHEQFQTRGDIIAGGWYGGYGVDLGFATGAFERLEAVPIRLAGRAEIFTGLGGGGLEVTAGVSPGPRQAIGLASAGLFWGIYYVSLGYTAHAAIGRPRPAWLPVHNFSLRVHVPVAVTDVPPSSKQRTAGSSVGIYTALSPARLHPGLSDGVR